jgi:hypothetical protein
VSRPIIVGVALVASVAALPQAYGQNRHSTFVVSVAETPSGAPIGGAEVFLPELRRIVRTDSLGQAMVAGVPLGAHRVRVRRLGFVASDVTLRFEGDTTGAVFRLERSATQLASVNVTADEVPQQLKDFESRRKQGIGRFLTETDLSRDANRDFTDVATVRFPGLAVKSDEFGKPHIASVRANCGAAPPSGGTSRGNAGIVQPSKRGGAGGGLASGPAAANEGGGATAEGSCYSTRPCLVQVYLDDINMGEADGLVRTWDLAGAEYYTGASMPARYRTSGSACGVLLLWSKWR